MAEARAGEGDAHHLGASRPTRRRPSSQPPLHLGSLRLRDAVQLVAVLERVVRPRRLTTDPRNVMSASHFSPRSIIDPTHEPESDAGLLAHNSASITPLVPLCEGSTDVDSLEFVT